MKPDDLAWVSNNVYACVAVRKYAQHEGLWYSGESSQTVAPTRLQEGHTAADRGFTTVFTSQASSSTGPAPAGRPHPVVPKLQFQSYDVEDPTATHVQLRAISNQCTGGPAYQGDPDAANNSDCTSGSDEDRVVRAAELEVFGR